MAVRNEVLEKMSALVIAAFGLVAALAWNSAIQAIFARFYGEASTMTALILYAVIVTVIAVIVTIIIGKASQKAKK